MLLPLLLITLGLLLLVAGADALVSGASRIARKLGIPPLIIGLTVVAFGTSAPEIVVSTTAALTGNTALALGNVVGSNIFNVLLILGITALILPLVVNVSIIRQEIPVMIGFSGLLMFFLRDAVLSAPESGILVCLGLVYVLLLVLQANRASKHGESINMDLPDATGWSARLPAPVAIVAGLTGLVAGARLLVGGASSIALTLGVDELIVGLTVVAIGTSLPEIAASVAAVIKGERDLAIGNVIGSNIFNIALCLGIAGVIAPSGLIAPEQLLEFDLKVMVAAALILLPVAFTGYVVSRVEGGVLLVWSILYLLLTVLTAISSPLFPRIFQISLFALLPLTLIYLAATMFLSLKRKQAL